MPDIRKLVRRAIFVSAGIGLIGAAAVSAQAKDNGDAGMQKYEVVKGKDGTVKYCTKLPPVTGSRISQEICKTQDQWKALGVTLNVG
ncbi:MAG: hypothetical protein ACTHM0_08190 [Sphingomonas sp.]